MDVCTSCWCRQELYCNLGWSLAAADINSDGFSDLVVATPFAPSTGHQRGMIAILYASSALQGPSVSDFILYISCHLFSALSSSVAGGSFTLLS